MKLSRKTLVKIFIIVLPAVLSLLCVFIAGWKNAISIAGISIVVISSIVIGGWYLGKSLHRKKYMLLRVSVFMGALAFLFMMTGTLMNFLFNFKTGITFEESLLFAVESSGLAFGFCIILGLGFNLAQKILTYCEQRRKRHDE